MAYLPLRTLWRENAPRAILGLSRGILRRSSLSLLGLSSVWGNSRATSGGFVWGSQTRLCRDYVPAGRI